MKDKIGTQSYFINPLKVSLKFRQLEKTITMQNFKVEIEFGKYLPPCGQ